MPRTVVIDELHLTFRIPANLTDAAAVTIHHSLSTPEFIVHLRRAVRAVLPAFPQLAAVQVSLSR